VETKSVTIRVRATESVLNDLTAEDFSATADLADATTDVVAVPVRIESKQAGVDVIEVTPSQVTVRLEDVTFRTVPVRTKIVGTPPRGFQAGELTVSPEAAIITGPESLVERVQFVEADVNLTGVSTSFEQELILQARDEQGGNVLGVNIEPATAVVTAEIEQLEFSAAFIVQPEIIGVPATGFSVTAIEVQPPLVTVTGPASVFQTIDPVDGIGTVPVSIDGASSDVVRTVAVLLPENASVDQEQVTVRIVIRPTVAALTFEVPVDVINIGPGLTPELDQDVVRVTITGSLIELAGVSAADIAATLDLEGIDAGTYTIAVQVEPSGDLEVILVAPTEIIVDLRSS
jgi:YbbR domain-containing protein